MFINKNFFWSFVFIAVLLIATGANAFSISPLKYTITLNPGDEKDLIVNFKNNSQEDKNYSVVVLGVQQDQQGRPIFITNSDVAENWIKVSNENEIIKGGENKKLVYTISVPKNSPPGAHYLGLGVREKNEQFIGGQLVTLVFLQVAGTANESLIFEKFKTVKKYYFDNNLSYLIQVRNNGNVDLSLKAKIEINDFKNKIIYSQPIDLGNKLFAQSNRSTEFFPSIEKKIFWPGHYKSTIVVNFGLTNQQIAGSSDFWYFPVWSLGLAVIFIIVILVLISFKKNKHETLV